MSASEGDQSRQQPPGGNAANPSIVTGPASSTDDIHATPGVGGTGSAQATAERTGGGARAGRVSGGRRRGRRDGQVVPDATFTSYYGRPVVKAAPWEADIPTYLFTGGLAAGSSLLAAGADLSGRPALRRGARIGATGALFVSMAALIRDLGRPDRFLHMLRVFKPTSPMSVGTWVLAAYGPGVVTAGAAEVARLLPFRLGVLGRLLDWSARPGGLAAAAIAPAMASYTAVLLSDTSTPAWHEAHRELPFVFAGSAATAAGGLGMLVAPVTEAGPARLFALVGAAGELVAERRMEATMGLVAEALHSGKAGVILRVGQILAAGGALGTLLAGRSRTVAVVSGLALLGGSACTRFGIFEAGMQSARDPKYTVVPQRERLNARRATEAAGQESASARPA